MEIIGMIVLAAIGAAWMLRGWHRLRHEDGRVPRKPLQVDIGDETDGG
jgi:hypothetical protein